MSANLIIQFKDLPNSGVGLFLNEQDKTFYVFFSPSFSTSFCTHLCKLKDNIHENFLLQDAFNKDLLQLTVYTGYSKDPGSIILRSDYQLAVKYNQGMGYSDMRSGYKAVSYKVKSFILNDFRSVGSGDFTTDPLVYVCAKSANGGCILLGIFRSIPESEEWVTSVYGRVLNGVIPKFAYNELTNLYRDAYGDRLMI